MDAEEAAHRLDASVIGGINPDQDQSQHNQRGDLPAPDLQQHREHHHGARKGRDHPDPVGFQEFGNRPLPVGQRDQTKARDRREHPEAETAALGRCAGRAAQRSQRQQDRIFGDPREGVRRYQAREQSADHAAKRQRNVKARKIARGRPRTRQFTMAGHGNDEETKLMPAKRQQQILFAADHQKDHHARDSEWLEKQHQPMRQQRARLEHQHPCQKIQRQRQHPQQRRGRDVGGYVRRHRDQKTRRHGGQKDPAQPCRPAWRGCVPIRCADSVNRHRRRAQQQNAAGRDQDDE